MACPYIAFFFRVRVSSSRGLDDETVGRRVDVVQTLVAGYLPSGLCIQSGPVIPAGRTWCEIVQIIVVAVIGEDDPVNWVRKWEIRRH